MNATVTQLRQRVVDLIGPGPGPEEFVIEELAPGIYAWHLKVDGEIRSPLQAPPAWKAYAKKAQDALKAPGSGVVIGDSEAGR